MPVWKALSIEHQLIERMMDLGREEVNRIRRENTVDPAFLDTIIDFYLIYVIKTHNWKEEEILIRDLAKKDMLEKDEKVMEELIQEHVFGRVIVSELAQARERYLNGDIIAVEIVARRLSTMVQFYTKHIEKEDDIFFPAVIKYLSQEEKESMLQEFMEFDRKMIHEKYNIAIETLKRRPRPENR